MLSTSQIGYTLGVDLELVTFQMLADESQQRVEDPHCSRHCGGRRVSVACRDTQEMSGDRNTNRSDFHILHKTDDN